MIPDDYVPPTAAGHIYLYRGKFAPVDAAVGRKEDGSIRAVSMGYGEIELTPEETERAEVSLRAAEAYREVWIKEHRSASGEAERTERR